jgi:polyphosphate kinase
MMARIQKSAIRGRALNAVTAVRADLSDCDLYLNRELSWLEFNKRVLHEAEDKRTPLLERVKFLAIVSSNIDEFFMKRVGGLKQQIGAGITDITSDGRTPAQQIEECYVVVRRMEQKRQRVLREILTLLEETGIFIVTGEEISEKEKKWLREHYSSNIFPLITPQSIDPAHPFPFISNLSLNLLVTLRYQKDREISQSRVKVPVGAGIPRFVRIQNTNRFIPLEDLMSSNLDILFPGMIVEKWELFRVTRNSNTERNEEQADDLLVLIESELRERKFAPIVRLEVMKDMDTDNRGRLASECGLDKSADVFEVSGMMAMRDMFEIASLNRPELHDAPHHPIDHPKLQEERSVFHVIRDEKSLLIQHPYESFATSVERFLHEASTDPKVRAIKISLYRTTREGRIVEHLINAAQNGKQVAVVVELKARFDEAANIELAERMEEEGIHVTYGVVGLKTHCKVILVVRQDFDGLRRYVHIGTGNYHPVTARIYSDLGLFTCDDAVGQDATELFNYLTTGYTPKRNYKKLLPAPKVLKKAFLRKIEREINHQKETKNGLIRFKMNAMEDVEIVKALYRASQAGVNVDLIVRDSCRLRPGVPGISENIRVVSIVGRFLEHSRIFYFHNNGGEEYYIGSADAMRRNLESRVEVVAPVESPALQRELRVILDTHLNDRRSAWDMQPDGSYKQRKPSAKDDQRGSQEILIDLAQKRLKAVARLRKRKSKTFISRQ